MLGFKTHFQNKGYRTDVSITPLEHDCYGVELETTGEENAGNPTEEHLASKRPPDMVVQRTRNGNWTIIDQGTFELDDEDLQALGRAIESHIQRQ